MSKVIEEFHPHAFADSLQELNRNHGIAELDELTLLTLIDLLRRLPSKIQVTEDGWNPCQ